MIDANLNRSREALRVIEDYARFALNNASLAGCAKSMRHDLAQCAASIDDTQLLRSRDTLGDVGTSLEGRGEYARSNVRAVAVAAGKRLAEALRVLEEVFKTLDGAAVAAGMEQLRYRAYSLEQRIGLAVAGVWRGVRLYVLITESACAGDWYETAIAAIEGGADGLQLREKALTDSVLRERAIRLATLCRERDVVFMVNDRPDVAVVSGADGVHVGQDDLHIDDARRVVGPERIVGVSTHTVDQARAAVSACPDYIAVGPMFASTTKPRELIPGPEVLASVRSETDLPLVAIGGITVDTVADLVRRGCDCVCVCAAVVGQSDVRGAARGLKDALERALAAALESVPAGSSYCDPSKCV